LALKTDGSVLAWGDNEFGELGNGSGRPTSYTPTPVAGLGPGSGVVAIAAGGAHSMALKSDGTVLTWGYSASLGRPSGQGASSPGVVTGLGPGSGVIKIATGGFHSLALKSNGQVVAWGENAYGQLGDGTTTDRDVPTPVTY